MKTDTQPSDRGAAFAEWFKSLLPATVRLAPTWRAKWAKLYDDLMKLDSRAPEQIAAVCKWARAHEFWQANFLSPIKLRERDRSGAMYFDRFLAAMDPQSARRAATASREYTTPRGGARVE